MLGFHRTHKDSQAAALPSPGKGREGAAAWATTENKNAPGAGTPDALNRNALPTKGASHGSPYTTPLRTQAQRCEPAAADDGDAPAAAADARRAGRVHQALADHRGGSGRSPAYPPQAGATARLDAHLVGSVAAIYRLTGGAR